MTSEAPFAPLAEYVAAQSCPTCKARPGEPCVMRIGTRKYREYHLPRYDRGRAHYQRDFKNAPWPEDREPGKCYSTIGGAE